MKAISLWQPWATAIALGSKRIETRHWATNYRGPIAIHAAKRCVVKELQHMTQDPLWQAALHYDPEQLDLVAAFPPGSFSNLHLTLPFGAIVATARLVDCLPCNAIPIASLDGQRTGPMCTKPSLHWWTERDMGWFKVGRFGWILEDIQPLAKPVPFTGRQQLFEVPDSLLIQP